MASHHSLGLLLFALVCWTDGSTRQPPNIVLIVADDLGWNDVSFHGSQQIPTPNIDALAYDGIILNNYYVQPICTPTRSAIMTGRYPMHTGMQHSVLVGSAPYGLGLNETLLPQHLRQLGYSTHMIGKWHLGFYAKEYTPTYRGFSSHYGYYQGMEDYYNHQYWARYPNPDTNGFDFRDNMDLDKSAIGKYSTHLFTKRAEDIISKQNKSEPLFLYVAQQAVHSADPPDPLQAPPEYIAKFSHIANEKRRKYAAMVSVLDESVGNITKALGRAGMLANTVIIFTTDNGGPVNGFDWNAASNWPLRGCKALLWEGGTRGVGFMWSPLFEQKGYTSHHMMHVVDWLPTVLSVAGFNLSSLLEKGLDGMDMWHTLSTNQESSPRTNFVYNIDPWQKTWAVRARNLKLLSGHGLEGEYSGWFPPWQYDSDGPGEDPVLSRSKRASGLSSVQHLDQGHDITGQKVDRRGPHPDVFSTELPSLIHKYLGYRPRAQGSPVVVECGPKPANASTNCQPHKAPCLYDIYQDPCEFNNLAPAMPETVKEMLSLFDMYNKTAVPPKNLPQDPKGFPVNHGGAWVPWVTLPPN